MKSLETSPINRPIYEIQENNLTRFIYEKDGEKVGSVCATLIGNKKYDISGLFVDPTKRGQGIASGLIKTINTFLQDKKSMGVLVNMALGDASNVYENNGWKKGEYKSDGQHGGYEFTFDAREKSIDAYPKLGYCYKGIIFNKDGKIEKNVIYKGIENSKMIVFDGENEYTAKLCDDEGGDISFEIEALTNK